MRTRLGVLLVVVALVGAAAYYFFTRTPDVLVLTGIVTTNDVIVSPQIAGQLTDLRVTEGDTVKAGQVLAVISPAELQADSAYYAQSAEGATAQVQEGEAALRYERQQTDEQIRQAQAALAAAEADQKAAEADLESATLTFTRTKALADQGVASADQSDQARTARDAAKAKVDSLAKQVDAARAAVALAQSNAAQVDMRQRALEASQHQRAAAEAQRDKADVRLAYAELHAPVDGVVDVRAARLGEFVNAGQPVVTLINPDDLWVRVDIEETYIERVRLGDTLTVRLPSGVERTGTVFYRGIDAGFATQRDVSRTKRDIKTFEVRLRVDNKDRRLAVGMTAYVLLPIGANSGLGASQQ